MSKCDIKFSVLGVAVNVVQIPEVIAQMEEWIARRGSCQYIAVTGMHGITEAQHSENFKSVMRAASLVVPDGYPLVWLGRRKGFSDLRRRVYGPELMASFWEQTAAKSYRHFFYGGAPGVAEELVKRVEQQYPELIVAGTYCPPFRTLTKEEDLNVVAAIEGARPDIVWVGLGTPKQEQWMFDHCGRLRAPVLVGVGAAFDFYTKRVAQAPEWMRENGLEWLFRLVQEPRRLWRRYLVHGSEFAILLFLEALGLKKFDESPGSSGV
ncbi:MAG TPA: WecB/TagA/CpsF family glycosyltransferase [Bryobacteraceae bacterium]|nr:WecB/TagA/CpsF family glycosyltransferase [Bryobacteraceae bacterium]